MPAHAAALRNRRGAGNESTNRSCFLRRCTLRIHPALLLVPALFVACHDSTPTSPEAGPIAFETVVSAFHSGFTAPVRRTLRSQQEWAAAWQTLHAGQSPTPPLPAVDFGQAMVVLVATGSRPNGCFAIDVTQATMRASGVVEIEVTETKPGSSCVCTLAITHPVHAVTVPRVAGPTTFVERTTERRC